MFASNRWRVCRDDTVYILSGPDKGKTGKVLQVIRDKKLPQVIVEGCNLRKMLVKTGPDPDDSFVVTVEAPLHYSQVQVANPVTGKPTRVVFMYTPEGERVRVLKPAHAGEEPTVNDVLPTPPELDEEQERLESRRGLVGKKDTPTSAAHAATYRPAEGFPLRPAALEAAWARKHGRGLWREVPVPPEEGAEEGAEGGPGAGAAELGAGGEEVEGALVPYGSVRARAGGKGGASSSGAGGVAGGAGGRGMATWAAAGAGAPRREVAGGACGDEGGQLRGSGCVLLKGLGAASFAAAGLVRHDAAGGWWTARRRALWL